jgi:arylsulfatase A-like enzyme
MTRPNILYLHTHDCGRFISPYGYDMPTPNLMRFAREGVVFRQACCASPTCSPSRAALLFGQYGHVNGMMGLAWEGDRYEPKDFSHHLVPFLKSQGYQTAMAGVHHISKGLKTKIGYDRVLDLNENGTLPEEADDGVTTDLSIEEAADRFLHEEHERPFFLSVGFGAPHRVGSDRRLFNKKAVYIPPESDACRYERALPIYPDNAISRSETANFKAGVKIMDDQFGAVLNALERSGHKENTLVILTTDHGPGMPGMKCTLTDWGIGVFLMLRGPRIPSGSLTDSLVSHVDLFPTLAEYLGQPRPDWLQGKSLMPILRGETEEVNTTIYAEQGHHGCPKPLRAIRSSRYKLIRCYKTDVTEDYYDTDKGPVYDFLMQEGLDQRPVPEVALYDLTFDPMERCNVADNPAYREVREQLEMQLNKFMDETDDPLVNGILPPSPMEIANRRATS